MLPAITESDTMSLEIEIANVDLLPSHLEDYRLPEEPVLTSAALEGASEPLLRADLFAGPVTFLPESADHYTIFAPLHAGVVAARHHVGGGWQDIVSSAPQVHLQHPGNRVGWRWAPGAQLLRMQFNPAGVQRFVSSELRLFGSDSRIKEAHVLDDSEICRIAGLLADVLADPRPGQAVMFDALSRMCLVHMARTYLASQRVVQGGISGDQLSNILDYIDAHLSEQIRIHDLSDLAHMSESAFLRAIKAATGETPHELVRRRRLEAAQRLLREDLLSLGQIASITGFADQAHLSRSFKRAFGISPSRWRRSDVKVSN